MDKMSWTRAVVLSLKRRRQADVCKDLNVECGLAGVATTQLAKVEPFQVGKVSARRGMSELVGREARDPIYP